eukprot:UN13319
MVWMSYNKQLKDTILLKQAYPEYIFGFDLVQEERRVTYQLIISNIYYSIFKCKFKSLNLTIPFVFHAGETMKSDNHNVVDSVVLGTKRIGHGINSYR